MYSPPTPSGAARGSSPPARQNEQCPASALADMRPWIPSSPMQSLQTNLFELLNLDFTRFAAATADSMP